MTFIKLLPSMISVQGITWLLEPLNIIWLFLEGIVYEFVTYTYRLFSIMCSLNFNSLSAIVAPLMDRFKALIIVLVLFKLGMMLINMMMNPNDLTSEGKKLLINIFITAALLICNNFIFTVLNEISMLMLGTPEGYNYTVLNEIAGVQGGKDAGVIMRFVFGESESVEEIGDFIAFQTAGIFVRSTGGRDELAAAVIEADGQYNFMNLHKVNSKIGKTVEYMPLAGLLIGGFLVYTFFNICAEIGIRMFKLLVLQMMAPLAIVTIIKDGWKGSTMQSFIKEYTSIYIQAFVRILSTLVITVIVAKTSTNIDAFFDTAWGAGDNGITKCLILALVIFSAYKFVLEVPKLIDSLFKTNLASSSGKGGFASFLAGSVVGGGIGLATGAIGGFASGLRSGNGKVASGFNAVTGLLAGGAAGLAQGVHGGSKGNSIAENIRNGYKVREKTRARNDNWFKNGGALNTFGKAVATTPVNFLGIPHSQDRMMDIYTEQENALKTYEEARKSVRADVSDFENDIKAEKIKNLKIGTDLNGSGFANYDGDAITYGDSCDSFAQQMLEYNTAYQTADARYKAAEVAAEKMLEKDPSKTEAVAQMMQKAQRELDTSKQEAMKAAKKAWNDKRDKQTLNSDEAAVAKHNYDTAVKNLDTARKEANKSLSRTGRKRDSGEAIDLRTERSNIEKGRQQMTDRNTYKLTHDKNKSK